MSTKHWKILIPIIFAIAIALGLIARKADPYLQGKKTTLYFQHLPANEDKSLGDFYTQSQQLRNTQDQTASATFLAAGDIMLSRNVAQAIENTGKKIQANLDLPFSNMADILKSTDFNFANLESPAAVGSPIVGGHSMIFGAWSGYFQGLSDFNFKIVNLANNHAFDQGLKGLEYTIQQLDNFGIKHEGTGDNLDQAWQPAVVTTSSGLKICFVGASFSSINDGGKTTNNYVARIEDTERLKSAITQARSECDFVVATMHAGTEYTRTPNKSQTAFAHAAIDDGADIVIGAHPHWVQTLEKYQGKYIFYSLGNFIFDQEWSQDTKEGLTLKISISKPGCSPSPPMGEMPEGQRGCSDQLQGTHQPAHLDSIELLPVIIENYSTPRPATDAEAKKVLDKINQKEKILK